jgi:hypothetical protein
MAGAWRTYAARLSGASVTLVHVMIVEGWLVRSSSAASYVLRYSQAMEKTAP